MCCLGCTKTNVQNNLKTNHNTLGPMLDMGKCRTRANLQINLKANHNTEPTGGRPSPAVQELIYRII
jgi:hypothetical protein